MQRATTSGRRHNRAGSVTVAELIRKQPTPLRIPPQRPAASHGLVVDPPGDLEPPSTGRQANRATKLAGVATGLVVLLASVSAASMFAGNRPAGHELPVADQPAAISGASALRPDVLSAELGGRPLAPGPVVPAPAPATEGSPALPTGPNPQVDVVRRFYELLPTKPADASRLLSPELVAGAADFVASWGEVQAITVESTTLRPDGTVLAVVSMQERTGRWLRVEQMFRLTDTTIPRIVGTQVLSAQRS